VQSYSIMQKDFFLNITLVLLCLRRRPTTNRCDAKQYKVQCNLDLVTLNLMTTCDLVNIFQRPFFNLLHKIIRFSDIMQFSDSFCGYQKCH
jgi:hypothetical protein